MKQTVPAKVKPGPWLPVNGAWLRPAWTVVLPVGRRAEPPRLSVHGCACRFLPRTLKEKGRRSSMAYGSHGRKTRECANSHTAEAGPGKSTLGTSECTCGDRIKCVAV